jgi:hypothetical protein
LTSALRAADRHVCQSVNTREKRKKRKKRTSGESYSVCVPMCLWILEATNPNVETASRNRATSSSVHGVL